MPFEWNGLRFTFFQWRMFFSENRVSTFPEHALVSEDCAGNERRGRACEGALRDADFPACDPLWPVLHMSYRVASIAEMRSNRDYHGQSR
jgi:hypothetical protein